MGKLNPFNPNSVVAPPLFAGRREQTLRILNKLEHVQKGLSASFVLHGERGIGKTALAKLIRAVASGKKSQGVEVLRKEHSLNFLSTYYCVEKGQHFHSVLQASLNSLTDQLPLAALKRLADRLGSIFKNGKFSFGAFSVELEKPLKADHEQHLKDQAVSVLTNILEGLDEAGLKEGVKYSGLLIIIDEVHNVEDIEGIAQLFRNITTTLDVNGLGRVSFMILGYSEPIRDFFTGDPSARRSFDSILLTHMPKEEAKEVLIKGFDQARVAYDPQALEKHILSTGGYPHSIQVLGHHLIELDTDDAINADDWSRALTQTTIELQSKDFLDFYNFGKKPTMREQVLDIMAVIGRPVSKMELKAACDGKNIYQTTCLGELKRIGAVKEDRNTGLLTLQSQLFRTAILFDVVRRVAEQEQVDNTLLRAMQTYWERAERATQEVAPWVLPVPRESSLAKPVSSPPPQI